MTSLTLFWLEDDHLIHFVHRDQGTRLAGMARLTAPPALQLPQPPPVPQEPQPPSPQPPGEDYDHVFTYEI